VASHCLNVVKIIKEIPRCSIWWSSRIFSRG
jgi:hypothetical protein